MLSIERAERLPKNDEAIPDLVESRMFVEQVRDAIRKLKPIKQDVIILRFILGLPLQEVADILGRTLGSVKITQHRALKELREILEAASGEKLWVKMKTFYKKH